jgi:hypothetical protein
MRLRIASLLIVAILSSACAGISFGSHEVAPANTAFGLLRAVQNAPGTFMMASDKLIMIAWPEGSKYGFAVFSKDGNAVEQFRELASCTGTKAGCESMSDLVKYLRTIGWKRIFEVPGPVALQIKALADYFAAGSAAVAGTNFSVFGFMPAGAFDHDPLDEIYPQIEG